MRYPHLVLIMHASDCPAEPARAASHWQARTTTLMSRCRGLRVPLPEATQPSPLWQPTHHGPSLQT